MFFRPLLALALLSTSLLAAENWPTFRGPTGDGHSDATGLPVTFGDSDHVKWKTPIHGKAWSSPVIWGSQIWLTTANEEGTELGVVLVDKDSGKILRDDTLFHIATPQFCHKFNSYASPTPAIEEGRVYVTFGSPGTACIDTKTGKVLWQRTDFVCNHYRGAGSSPILWQNLLIMNFDGSDHQFIVALDKMTGKTVWETKRSTDYGDLAPDGTVKNEGDYRKAFATCHVYMQGGQPILLSSGAKAHYAYDPRNGKEIWRFDEPDAHSAATRPVVGDGLVYIPAGFGKAGLLAIKLGGHGVLSANDLAWRMNKKAPNKPSVTLVNGLLFTVNDGGIAACLDAKTGDVIWNERLGGNFSASPIYADGHMYAGNEEGKFYVFDAGRQFKVLATNEFPDGFMASPAVSGKALYLRTKTTLYRIEN
ncbi:Pyrrolo-quinoline quinone [Chthoniobacter flavus Ellin428]|uniref:Pyrrolo-quinoline quinone n=1 Tax=Chthoniobacter flavus Ellin428 TaxID=497964 RepID=B4D627_9BACT|nr:PQQ-like beta-propeller repeat protein [Chthoniobacter flavus]EDY18230.1 Pyrrolo-quinoline quinone [Chthoniobacter flavus Ellin428]TCO91421.1 putative pyrroloquinoline-quinone binding quinoprotein [Chthoniobacter flavus]